MSTADGTRALGGWRRDRNAQLSGFAFPIPTGERTAFADGTDSDIPERSVDENLKAVVEDFVVEAQEHLENIEAELLEIEENGENIDVDLVNKVFRGIHSIKGVAGFIGLDTIGDLSHVLESVLDLIRKEVLIPDSHIVDVMLQAADSLRTLIDDVEASNDADVSTHIDALQGILDQQDGSAPAADGESAPAEAEVEAESAAGAPSEHCFELRLPLGGMAVGLDVPLAELNGLVAESGEILEGAEELDKACQANEAPADSVRIVLVTDVDAEALSKALALPSESIKAVDRPAQADSVAAEEPAPQGASEPAADVQAPKKASTKTEPAAIGCQVEVEAGQGKGQGWNSGQGQEGGGGRLDDSGSGPGPRSSDEPRR